MRIIDLSSDVCSSDLIDRKPARKHRIQLVLFTEPRHRDKKGDEEASGQCQPEIMRHEIGRKFQDDNERTACFRQKIEETQEPLDQKNVGEGKSVEVRVELGGRGVIKKKKKQHI